MRAPLPPLSALRAFECAARHLNFTHAADELAMTQAAVSYQIRILEDRVGQDLFTRQPRGVALTPAGQHLARTATEALDLLRDGFAQARQDCNQTLVLNAAPSFATNFLAARLGRFQIANPDIAVRVEMSQKLVALGPDTADAAIRSGDGAWPDVHTNLLFDNLSAPMLSPALAEQIGGIHTPKDLLKLPFLDPHDPWWQDWFAGAGIAKYASTAPKGRRDFGPMVLQEQAIINGAGVGKLVPALCTHALSTGQLIQPFPHTLTDGTAFWFVTPKSKRLPAKTRAFRDWLLAEVATG